MKNLTKCVKYFFLGFVLGTKSALSQAESGHPKSTDATDVQAPSYFFYQQPEYPRDCLEVVGQCSSLNSSSVHLIKPDGYGEPFDVYCDSDGYTVIERRLDGLISFNRSWVDYETGFGFLAQEVWLGNKRLSYLTNQKTYQLRIDVTLNDGSEFYVSYDSFRISDDNSNYKLVSTGQNTKTVVTCPNNMVPGNCTCQRSCAEPGLCISACHVTGSCVCPDGFLMNDGNCLPENQCGCFLPEADGVRGTVLQEGDFYVFPNCSKRCSCSSGQLDCEDDFQCSQHGTCGENSNGWNCSCNEGYEGDGIECTAIVTATDCQDIFNNGQTSSGVYLIDPSWSPDPFQVYCNMTDGGGWTVFQRRVDGSQDFYLDWASYKNGFGNLNREFWLGNDKLCNLTNQRDYQIRIDFVHSNGAPYYAKYTSFRINDENDNYRLSSLGTYSGTAGDGMQHYRNQQYSTKDRDNDARSSDHCAQYLHGAWWYKDCAWSLNGDYHASSGSRSSIYWYNLPGSDANIKFTEMKIRPI